MQAQAPREPRLPTARTMGLPTDVIRLRVPRREVGGWCKILYRAYGAIRVGLAFSADSTGPACHTIVPAEPALEGVAQDAEVVISMAKREDDAFFWGMLSLPREVKVEGLVAETSVPSFQHLIAAICDLVFEPLKRYAGHDYVWDCYGLLGPEGVASIPSVLRTLVKKAGLVGAWHYQNYAPTLWLRFSNGTKIVVYRDATHEVTMARDYLHPPQLDMVTGRSFGRRGHNSLISSAASELVVAWIVSGRSHDAEVFPSYSAPKMTRRAG